MLECNRWVIGIYGVDKDTDAGRVVHISSPVLYFSAPVFVPMCLTQSTEAPTENKTAKKT